MGNGVRKLNHCFAGDVGEISKRHNDLNLTDPLDEGLGHSFCYIRPDPYSKPHLFSDDSSSSSTTTTISSATSTTTTAAFCTISGASISANTFTPLSTAHVDFSAHVDKASAFESSQFFSSIPLQPIPRGVFHSGPIPARVSNTGLGSGPVERGFMSGPIERSFISGPMENQYDHIQRYKLKSKKWGLIRSLKKVFSSSFFGYKEVKFTEKNNINVSEVKFIESNINVGNVLSSENSLGDDDDEGNDSFRGQNVQWAQGKAGEDRVHVVISEEHGWVFVGIYDGFNGPDATDFLLSNLYSNVYKELKGLLWNDKSETPKNSMSNEVVSLRNSGVSKVEHFVPNQEFDGVSGVDHSDVLKALSEGLRKTEASYLEIADMMVNENPELALMGSCVMVMLLKDQDVYLLNVGDSRAVLAQNLESDLSVSKFRRINEQSVSSIDALYRAESDRKHNLVPAQLTMDHSTSIKEEVVRIRSEHPDDAFAIKNDRVKGSLKVTRAFGAGYLKQAKWNNALLEMFRIDYIGNSPYINCLPSLHHHTLGSRDKFLILSSDGLYQYFTNEEAVSEVETFMSIFPEGDPAQHLVEEVLFRAAKKAGLNFHELLDIPQGDRRKYHDDVSIIILSFEGRIWKSSM
ncbi:probable protein phosphatase 2C 23 isoform X1 [Solanum tuberosum]|uniref:protein-serine/threonine phosphatase n=1 Tax=Solanum tuberosum TaxID=4113 RepID=M1AH81_SOLTU|nr:PREDICTED: probable protein phosphatase 2C 23 isoform X2 [Solanum tuberosum]XP_015161459.1 PREDICTED: probable protein phosphatase 2C 23 isoform X1 [Solanum tuberosum]